MECRLAGSIKGFWCFSVAVTLRDMRDGLSLFFTRGDAKAKRTDGEELEAQQVHHADLGNDCRV